MTMDARKPPVTTAGMASLEAPPTLPPPLLASGSPRRSYGARLRTWLQRFGSIIALVVLTAAAGTLIPNFLSEENIRSQLQTFGLETALLAVGQTLVVLTGGIDLSVGSLLAVGSCLAGSLVLSNVPFPLVFIIPMLLTTGLGAISGIVVSKARIQPIVVTLAMLIAARGLAQLITGGGGQGHTLDLSNNLDFSTIATTQLGPLPVLGPIPISVVLALVVYAITAFFLSRTALGRYVFAVGGNERAARLSGVAADRVKILVYALSGLLAGLAGVLFASHNATADPFNDGLYFELTTIAAVVVGGTSLLGGVGSVWRTLVGGLILVVLYALLVQFGLSQPAQLIARGLIIAGAVLLQGGGES